MALFLGPISQDRPYLQYNVECEGGSLEADLFLLLESNPPYDLILTLERDGESGTVKVTFLPEDLIPDPHTDRDTIRHIAGAEVVEIDERGEETDNLFPCYLELWLDVTTPGQAAGKLRLWQRRFQLSEGLIA